MNEPEVTPELLSFYSLLENAFPQHEVTVAATESSEMYLNELQRVHFGGQDWRLVDFPEFENDSMEAAFSLLDDRAKLYYIAAFMREAIIDPYYQVQCFGVLKSFLKGPERLMAQLDAYQRESIVWFCDMVEKQIGELPMLERISCAADLMSAKYIRSAIRDTVW